ncbi:hypothetical protein [Saccharibacillus sacchari]|uniref:Uncharacterized protein n=1 Tax=Saccharibacillus sacchari TaxID=456493 RepID=A0ACC6PJH8_9BACL
MKQITTAMCETAEGTRFYNRITDAIHTAQIKNQSYVVIELQSGCDSTTFGLLFRSKGFHVEEWSGIGGGPERLYIGW